MARALTVQNAEINTASITIRTLQVEGRQVTLAVFRQLPVEDIIDADGPSLRGVGWGHVNYLLESSSDYSYTGRTIHLVWQLSNELRRCVVHQILRTPSFIFRQLPREATTDQIEYWRKRAEASPASPDNVYYKEIVKKGEDEQALWRTERQAALVGHRQEERWIMARNALVAPLFDLPQLFIAV